MDNLTDRLMVAYNESAKLAATLWNALVRETEAHEATKAEMGGLRERVQGKERDL